MRDGSRTVSCGCLMLGVVTYVTSGLKASPTLCTAEKVQLNRTASVDHPPVSIATLNERRVIFFGKREVHRHSDGGAEFSFQV